MAVSKIGDVAAQVQEFWSPLFMQELREQTLLAGLVNKEYEGEIRRPGDTVKVSQIDKPNGQLKTVGVDADSFDSETITTQQVSVVADKRAVASYEFEDLVMVQSQLESQDSEIRQALLDAVEEQINDYLYSLIAPSASSPDHDIGSVTDFDASQLSAVRTLAAQAKWRKDKGWWALLSPQYYGDLLNAQTLTSSDYIPDQPVVGGQIVNQRFGFNILEDNSRTGDHGLLFHPDWLLHVQQTEPTFKISDQHSSKKFGFVMSVDVVFGAKLGIDGDVKHVRVAG